MTLRKGRTKPTEEREKFVTWQNLITKSSCLFSPRAGLHVLPSPSWPCGWDAGSFLLLPIGQCSRPEQSRLPLTPAAADSRGLCRRTAGSRTGPYFPGGRHPSASRRFVRSASQPSFPSEDSEIPAGPQFSRVRMRPDPSSVSDSLGS